MLFRSLKPEETGYLIEQQKHCVISIMFIQAYWQDQQNFFN